MTTQFECDLVMKGGVTSGIVYPPALQALSGTYRFRSIGGTSAGAIAAVCAAAAEYGRQTAAPSPGGFDGLTAISNWLATNHHLQELFQADRSTEPLMKLLLDLLALRAPRDGKSSNGGKIRIAFGAATALFKSVPIACTAGGLIGALLAMFLFVLPWMRGNSSSVGILHDPVLLSALIPVVLFAAVGALVCGVVRIARILLNEVPKNYFGICRGHLATESPQPVLTDWLNARINELAGLAPDDVLTFGHLRGHQIELAMVTTCLSHGRPYTLPFVDRRWIFRREDIEKFFPATVVWHMIENQPDHERLKIDREKLRSAGLGNFYFVPDAEKFPVIVAARMSLSFPVLLSALPLYRPNFAKASKGEGGTVTIQEVDDLDQCWLSDGGISSNFPIHFFDSWLPSRPTFGINLVGMPREENVKQQSVRKSERFYSSQNGRVFLRKPGEAAHEPEWMPVHGLGGLIGAIWNTAQNFRDNLQSELHGYSERIVHIRLDNNEGGLNLSMPPSIVKHVQDYGREAGAMLADKFSMPAHQWTRMLTLLPLFETNLETSCQRLSDPHYADLLRNGPPADAPYQRDARWLSAAGDRASDLAKLLAQWVDRDQSFHEAQPHVPAQEWFFPHRRPKPTGALRVVPGA